VRIGHTLFTLGVTNADPDSDAIDSFTAAPLPNGARFDVGDGNRTGTLTLLPSFSFSDSFVVTFSAASHGLTGSATTVIRRRNVDHPPVVTVPATATVAENQPLTVTVSATDEDGDPIFSLVATSLPAGATFTPSSDNSSGTLSWTPTYSQAGLDTVVFKATSNTLSDSESTVITVTNVDRAPVVSVPDTVLAKVLTPLAVTATASDPDSDAIASFKAAPLPAGATFTPGTGNASGTLAWTPGAGDTGVRIVTFTAANAMSAAKATVIRVLPAHQPPVASLVMTPSAGSEPLTLTADATGSSDLGGQIVSYRFDFGDGSVVGPQPSAVAVHTYAAGTWTAVVTVTDNDNTTATASAQVVVTPPPNLCLNPSFESNTTGWSALASAALTRVAGGYVGGYAAQLTSTSGNTSSFGLNDHPDWVTGTTAAGLRYRYSAWVRSPSNTGTSKIQVTEYLVATGASLGQVTSAAVKLSPAWQKLTVDYVTKSAASTLDFWIKDWPLVAGETFQIDNVSVINVVTAAPAGPVMAAMPARAAVEPIAPDVIPLRVRLCPSPLDGTGTLSFATSKPGVLEVEILDVSGRRVRQLASDTDAPAGMHVFALDGRNERGLRLGAGIYFYRIRATEGVRTGRFVSLR
jgi:hypothetical protein